MRSFRVVMAVLLAVCILPFVSLLLAFAVADLGHCQLDEGSVHPCLIAGIDVGPALLVMSMAGWLGIATLPLLLATLVLWVVVELIQWLRRRGQAA